MTKIKNFLIIIFSVLSCINIAHTEVIHNKYYTKINKHVLMNQKNKHCYSIKIANYTNNNNDFINLILFGRLQANHHIISYFTFGYNFNRNHFKFVYNKIHLDAFNSVIFGIYINHIGTIECGKNYNLIYDIKYFAHKNFYNDYIFSKKFHHHNIFRQIHSSITYRNTKLFGLIDHLTIALQYQYPNGILNNLHKNFFSHSIRYDFKKLGISIINIYSADIYHYFFHFHNKNLNSKHISFALGVKYHLYKLYISYFYTKCLNSEINLNQSVSFHSKKHFEWFTAYQISPQFYINLAFLKSYKIFHLYPNDKIFLKNTKHLNQSKYFNTFNQINISLEYLYNKHIFLYFSNKIHYLNNIYYNFLNFKYNNGIKIGMIYFF